MFRRRAKEGEIATQPTEPAHGSEEPVPQPGRNLPLAIITGLALAGLVLGTLFTSRLAFFVLVTVAVLVAQKELYQVLAARGFRTADTLGIVTGGLLLFLAYRRGDAGGIAAVSFVLTLGVVAALIWFVVDPERERAMEGVAATVFGLVYIPFLASHVVLMSLLPHGPAITVGFFGVVAFYDIGAFAFGSILGRHPLARTISPKKTWEGAAGASLLILVLAMAVGPHIGPFTLESSLALAGIAVVLAPLGDLAESMIKRDLDVKDMGGILPGHGGVLDRIDSLLLVAPGAYWLARAIA